VNHHTQPNTRGHWTDKRQYLFFFLPILSYPILFYYDLNPLSDYCEHFLNYRLFNLESYLRGLKNANPIFDNTNMTLRY